MAGDTKIKRVNLLRMDNDEFADYIRKIYQERVSPDRKTLDHKLLDDVITEVYAKHDKQLRARIMRSYKASLDPNAKTYTWEEVKERLDKIRGERKAKNQNG